MAKKSTLESFNNQYTYENFINKTNFVVDPNKANTYGNRNKILDKMQKTAKNGYDFFKGLQSLHASRQKPGFFSKLFNTKYNQLYNEEAEKVDFMRGDLYKMGVPSEILAESHKVEQNDIYKIKNGIDDALYGVTHGNMSQKADRWINGNHITISENGVDTKLEPKDILEAQVDEVEEVKEPLDLSNEFEVETELGNFEIIDEYVPAVEMNGLAN